MPIHLWMRKLLNSQNVFGRNIIHFRPEHETAVAAVVCQWKSLNWAKTEIFKQNFSRSFVFVAVLSIRNSNIQSFSPHSLQIHLPHITSSMSPTLSPPPQACLLRSAKKVEQFSIESEWTNSRGLPSFETLRWNANDLKEKEESQSPAKADRMSFFFSFWEKGPQILMCYALNCAICAMAKWWNEMIHNNNHRQLIHFDSPSFRSCSAYPFPASSKKTESKSKSISIEVRRAHYKRIDLRANKTFTLTTQLLIESSITRNIFWPFFFALRRITNIVPQPHSVDIIQHTKMSCVRSVACDFDESKSKAIRRLILYLRNYWEFGSLFAEWIEWFFNRWSISSK